MSNLTFDEGLIREHPPEPLEGHAVVVLERVGEAGEKFHALLGPGGEKPRQGMLDALLRKPDPYFAFAVDVSPARELTFSQTVNLSERELSFELRFTLRYEIADPRLLVMARTRDPLRLVRDRVEAQIEAEARALSFSEARKASLTAFESLVATSLPGLKAFALEYGIQLLDVQVRSNISLIHIAGHGEMHESTGTERWEHEARESVPDVGERPEDVRRRLDDLGVVIIGAVESGTRQRDFPEPEPEAIPAGPAAPPAPQATPAAPPSTDPEDVLYRVWYATNRRPMGAGTKLSYGGRPDTRVHLGSCDVVIPATHRMGELGSPWIRRFLTRTDDRLRLHTVRPLEPEPFWSGVRDVASSYPADTRHALVFIHGYRVSFKDAALRAAQLGYDLGIKGPVAFFAWPSRATVLGYPADGSAVEASERAITDFLLDFARNCGADRVHVIAHSMGNRPLLRALQRILASAESVPAVRFGHLVLAAPDVTRQLFLDVADQYRRLAVRTTLYVSNEDNALRVSFRLQGDRVGLAPPVTCAEGIDTVHVGNVDRTMLGHSTFAEARPVLTDIRALLNFNASPGDRGLDERKQGDDRYWEFRR